MRNKELICLDINVKEIENGYMFTLDNPGEDKVYYGKSLDSLPEILRTYIKEYK